MFTRHMISFIIVSSLVAVSPGIIITEWLKKIFPGIEIQTGKTLQLLKKEKLKKLLMIAAGILIPSIVVYFLRILLH